MHFPHRPQSSSKISELMDVLYLMHEAAQSTSVPSEQAITTMAAHALAEEIASSWEPNLFDDDERELITKLLNYS